MSTGSSILVQIRAKGILKTTTATAAPVPVADNSPQADMEAELALAVTEVSQPDAKTVQPVQTPIVPVSVLSARHQRRLGLPVTKGVRNEQVKMVRAIWRKWHVGTQPGG